MGKTNPTYRATLEHLEKPEWKNYRRMLRQRDQPLFDDLWRKARNHADAANAANPIPINGALFSMLLTQQREIVELQEELKQAREELGVNAGRIASLEHKSTGTISRGNTKRRRSRLPNTKNAIDGWVSMPGMHPISTI